LDVSRCAWTCLSIFFWFFHHSCDFIFYVYFQNKLFFFFQLCPCCSFLRAGMNANARTSPRAGRPDITFWGPPCPRSCNDSFANHYEEKSSNGKSAGRIVQRELEQMTEAIVQWVATEEAFSVTSTLQAIIREVQQLREEQRRTRAEFSETLRQRDAEVARQQQRQKEFAAMLRQRDSAAIAQRLRLRSYRKNCEEFLQTS